MEANTSLISLIASAFQTGGIWMIAILVAQIFSIAIIAERSYALFVQRKLNQKKLAHLFEDDIKRGQIERVISRAKSMSDHAIAAVVQAGAQAAHNMGGKEEIQARMEEVLSAEKSRIERRTGFLSMLANVGTLLGLLGTIVGLIQSFMSVANLNAAEKSIALTQGVSLAMNTTAYGLIMAIPAMIMFSILTNRTNRLQEEMNQAAQKVYNWLSFNYSAVGSSVGTKARSAKTN